MMVSMNGIDGCEKITGEIIDFFILSLKYWLFTWGPTNRFDSIKFTKDFCYLCLMKKDKIK